MISKSSIKQLENKFDGLIGKSSKKPFVICSVNTDDKLLDKNGSIFSDKDAQQIRMENKKNTDEGGLIVYLKSYKSSKLST